MAPGKPTPIGDGQGIYCEEGIFVSTSILNQSEDSNVADRLECSMTKKTLSTVDISLIIYLLLITKKKKKKKKGLKEIRKFIWGNYLVVKSLPISTSLIMKNKDVFGMI